MAPPAVASLEVFNITNNPELQRAGRVLGSATFGRITSTGNSIPRQFQFAAKVSAASAHSALALRGCETRASRH